MGLVGKTALVTGGSRGIGKAIALALAEAGAAVALTYYERAESAQRVAESIEQQGGDALALRLSLAEGASMDRLLAIVHASYGPVHILVNNAAIAQEKPFLALTEMDWSQMLTVNLQGPVRCCQAVVPDMLAEGWGRIVNMVSIGAQVGGTNQMHYAAAKAGLMSVTRSLARLYAHDGVTVNAVAPNLVATDMTAQELASEAGQAKVASIPLRRIGTAEEVASLVAYVCSPDAAYITGQCLNVNGGSYCG